MTTLARRSESTVDARAPSPPAAVPIAATTPVDRSLERAGLAIALGIVAGAALWRIDATALWVDEAYSLGAANHLGDSLRGTSGTMGLYYSFLSAWSTISTATWWLRLPSVVFTMATLVVLAPIARRVGGSRLVAVALPFTALGPLLAWKTIEARAYALETLVVVACWYVVIRAIDSTDARAERRWFAALAPLALAGVFCHGLFVVQLVPMGVVVLLSRRGVRAGLLAAAAMTPTAVVLVLLHRGGADEIGTNVEGGVGVIVASTLEALLARAPVPKLLLAQLLVVGVALGVRSACAHRDRTERAVMLVPAAWAVLPCLTLGLLRFYDPVYNPRYLVPVAPGVALVLATMAMRIDGVITAARPSTPSVRGIGVVSLATGLVMAAVLATSPLPIDDDWRGAATLVAQQAQEGDGIVFANVSTKQAVQQRPPFEAAWREVGPMTTPVAVSPPRPLAEVRRFDEPLPLDQIAPASAGLDRLWVVENRATDLGQAEAIIADPDLAREFRETRRWTFRPDLVVILLERAA